MTLHNRRRVLAAAGLTAIMPLAACGGSTVPGHAGSSPAAAGAGTIVIKNFMFHPMSLTVSPGATITIRNEDPTTHTLTDKADPTLFGTGDVGPGQTKTITAPGKAGSYPYICTIHQFMAGALVVR
ncbi:MAG TPA: cupredoxin domain-containing protein [Streptosporangiaceae bacterium]